MEGEVVSKQLTLFDVPQTPKRLVPLWVEVSHERLTAQDFCAAAEQQVCMVEPKEGEKHEGHTPEGSVRE